MKMFGSFVAGALAGFLLGSTNKGVAVRKEVDDVLKGLLSGDIKLEDLKNGLQSELKSESKSEEPLKKTHRIKLRKEGVSGNASDEDQESGNKNDEPKDLNFAADQPIDNGPLGLEKATELAEKLGAKVAEIQGEESLPHSHHIDIPTNKLSA